MKNKDKANEQLINELAELRHMFAELGKPETRHEQEFRTLAGNAPDTIAQRHSRRVWAEGEVEKGA